MASILAAAADLLRRENPAVRGLVAARMEGVLNMFTRALAAFVAVAPGEPERLTSLLADAQRAHSVFESIVERETDLAMGVRSDDTIPERELFHLELPQHDSDWWADLGLELIEHTKRQARWVRQARAEAWAQAKVLELAMEEAINMLNWRAGKAGVDGLKRWATWLQASCLKESELQSTLAVVSTALVASQNTA